jgi:hypothetical protein
VFVLMNSAGRWIDFEARSVEEYLVVPLLHLRRGGLEEVVVFPTCLCGAFRPGNRRKGVETGWGYRTGFTWLSKRKVVTQIEFMLEP